MSQSADILKYLKSGKKITPKIAYERFNSLALHSRISELRELGNRIRMRMCRKGNRRWGEYWLAHG